MPDDSPPYHLAVGKAGGDVVTAVVAADSESGAKSEAMPIWEQNEAVDVEWRHARGPFPRGLGAAAKRIRPSMCAGCGLHLWTPTRPPRPCETWFQRLGDVSDGESVAWECIQCDTITHLPMEATA